MTGILTANSAPPSAFSYGRGYGLLLVFLQVALPGSSYPIQTRGNVPPYAVCKSRDRQTDGQTCACVIIEFVCKLYLSFALSLHACVGM